MVLSYFRPFFHFNLQDSLSYGGAAGIRTQMHGPFSNPKLSDHQNLLVSFIKLDHDIQLNLGRREIEEII